MKRFKCSVAGRELSSSRGHLATDWACQHGLPSWGGKAGGGGTAMPAGTGEDGRWAAKWGELSCPGRQLLLGHMPWPFLITAQPPPLLNTTTWSLCTPWGHLCRGYPLTRGVGLACHLEPPLSSLFWHTTWGQRAHEGLDVVSEGAALSGSPARSSAPLRTESQPWRTACA